ncbi:MAG: hypothetical protein FWF57_10240 [Defluviitaleaceae bacterium]|nr:hypothetical protein [Defluviitaleaceae bacterium]
MKNKNLTILGVGSAVLLTLSACGLYAEEPQPTQEITQPELSRFSMDFLDVPYTIEEHIAFLAKNIRLFNEIAPTLWLNSSVLDIYTVVQEYGNDQLWLINTEGSISEITLEYALELGLDEESMIFDWHLFEKDRRGHFNRLNVENLNYGDFSNPRFAPLSPFKMTVHEAFHAVEQSKWANAMDAVQDPETFEILVSEEEFAEQLLRLNAEREEFLEETDARVARRLLIRDLRLAVVNRDNEDYTLTALATYRDFRENFPRQHLISTEHDRAEGTATYFDFVAILHTLFLDEVQTREGLDEAFAYFMNLIEYESLVTVGLILESYHVGYLSAMLLNRYVENDIWQQMIMDDYNVTPLSLLYDHFSGTSLPDPSVATQEFIDETLDLIERRRAELVYSYESLSDEERRFLEPIANN